MASLCASSALAAVAITSSSSQKSGGSSLGATKASFLVGRKLRDRKFIAYAGQGGGLSVRAAAAGADRPLWFPGSTPPAWLDGSLPGDFGFDPLGLGSDPESLRWNAMLPFSKLSPQSEESRKTSYWDLDDEEEFN
ncbi:Chlorophyll a-b binding protein [Thalictrum thalictroides]|uniref:Chlorophyll a-b binding protein, chloroplastic n=1 Tax=Thalictrum thalictroides TaxID=46969 RepID=A0A7J6UZH1_THATH|nr:Chlorophyll a-b binding protein [Thalictrum thalictroides]